jgi:hypothetical protein
MKSKLLLLGALGGVGYLIYRGMKKADAGTNLQYQVKRIAYKGSSLMESNFDVDLTVFNASTEALPFNKFFGTLKYKGSNVAVMNVDGAGKFITIQPQGSSVITVPVTISHLSTASAAVDIAAKILTRTPVNDLLLVGTLTVGPIDLPINQPISFPFGQQVQPSSPQITGIGCACSGVLN